jgi:diguanylate cyclase (GGDEF)-like protein
VDRSATSPRPPSKRVGSSRRAMQVITVGLAVVLLSTSIASIVSGDRRGRQAALDHALTTTASSGADGLFEYFDRAQTITLLLAHEPAIRGLEPVLQVVGPQATRISNAASDELAYLEHLYPQGISEACLIDRQGVERARVVRGSVAPVADLSTSEAENPFFAPTMRMPRGRVFHSKPYRSDDTHQWVISNSTPVFTTSGRTWGIVHFEVALASFRPHATRGSAVSVVDRRTGRVVVPGVSGSASPSSGIPARALRAAVRAGGASTVSGHRISIVPVGRDPGNANHWAVVASAPAPAWSHSVGASTVALALGGVLLLGLAALQVRAGRRRLDAAGRIDALTGLPNRSALRAHLDDELQRAQRTGAGTAVLILDLDRFRAINDSLGHTGGDQLLRDVAERLTAAAHPHDLVARLGGDEFALVLADVDSRNEPLLLARRWQEALHEPFERDGFSLHIDASIGIALAPGHGTDPGSLIRAADIAMSKAKEDKTSVAVYDPVLDVAGSGILLLLEDLRRALDTDQVFLHYQPKVWIDTGQLAGVEALVRWQHPVRGFVAPDEFVPAAEGTGLIRPLTRLTLELAVAQARRWLDAGQPVQVAVNLSAVCLLEPSFPQVVAQVLAAHRLPSALLRLEITESSVMVDPDRALALLTQLCADGIRLSIDDFGTGYSSMSYLKRLPADELKIDRTFVADMCENTSDHVLVRSSVELGHNLGMSVVAEGIEDEQTLAALADLGCDVAQGYHLGRPMSAEALTEWMKGQAVTSRVRKFAQAQPNSTAR